MAKERMTLANMCGGGVQEYIDRALAKVSDNILDLNTDAGKKREITVRIIFEPDENDREDVAVSVKTAVKLAPETGIETQLYISRDFKSGTISLIEHTKGQIKGQLTLDDCGMPMDAEAPAAQEKGSEGNVIDMRKTMNG
ncbi:MAG: replication terminator protein [Lachnospiraceae bacterium]